MDIYTLSALLGSFALYGTEAIYVFKYILWKQQVALVVPPMPLVIRSL